MKPQKLCSVVVITAAILMLPFALAFAVTGQTHLDPSTLTKYLDPLPAPAKLDGTTTQTVTITEFAQQVLPSNFKTGPYGGKTLVWGYNNSYPGPTIEARRGVPTQVTFLNNLPAVPTLQALLPIDQTLNWANPLNSPPSSKRYSGPQPLVAHFHGGEVPSAYDGNPNAWFTPGFGITGPDFVSQSYTYPNSQEASTFWYHDHTMGITRLNVYAGLAGFYLLRDPANEPGNLPSGSYEREIVIQDKMFDVNGQILYPDNGQDGHPFWFPMFKGDTIVVNGKVWPYLNVEPRRYRFRLLNGSIARFYTLQLQTTSGSAGPSFWQIGTDGGLLNKPVKVSSVTIAPGERVDLIVDFAGKQGTSFILKNSDSSRSSSSWGSGGTNVSEIMKVNVSLPLNGSDNSLNPSTGPNLRPNNPMVNLASTVTSSTPTRFMTLEKDRSSGALLLNGKFFDDPITEKPRVGATEVWQIDNHTGDTHPIHLHLIQFQVLSGGDSHHSGGSYGSDSTAGGWKDTVRVGSWGSVSIVAR
ncbi:MAG TPA: multicopper oxidase domain-containing protein, partial [Candidatus Paceibacterota bacterium]